MEEELQPTPEMEPEITEQTPDVPTEPEVMPDPETADENPVAVPVSE